MKRIYIILACILLASCAVMNFNGPIKADTRIAGFLAEDTILVVKESYSYKGSELPVGDYYPIYETTGGYIVYKYSKPIKVKSLWYSGVCSGGIAVSVDNLKDYFISVQNCMGEPNLRIDIENSLLFEIEKNIPNK